MATFTINVTITIDSDEPEEVEDFIQQTREYLTEKDSPFLTDYGPGAWGGYTGPFVTAVSVESV